MKTYFVTTWTNDGRSVGMKIDAETQFDAEQIAIAELKQRRGKNVVITLQTVTIRN